MALNQPQRGASDFEVMWHRLENWARWGRQDSCRPDPEAGSGSIYHMGRENWGRDEDAAPEEPNRINTPDAEALDLLIRRLHMRRRESVIRYFYRRRPVYRPLLDLAVRSLCDCER